MRVCLALIMISFTGMDLLAKEKKQKKNKSWNIEEYSGERDAETIRMAMASKAFSWLSGSPVDNEKLSVGKTSQFFGFVALRYASGRAAKRGSLGRAFEALATEKQKALMIDAVKQEEAVMKLWWECRSKILRHMEKHLYTGEAYNTKELNVLAKQFGYLNAKAGLIEAQAFAKLEDSLSENQWAKLKTFRKNPDLVNSKNKNKGKNNSELSRVQAAQYEDLFAKCFTWLTGTMKDNQVFPLGQPAQFFGFVAIRHKSGHGASRGQISKNFSKLLSREQSKLLDESVSKLHPWVEKFTKKRNALLLEMDKLRKSPRKFNATAYKKISEELGLLEVKCGLIEASCYHQIRKTMTDEQSAEMMGIRSNYIVDKEQMEKLSTADRGAKLYNLCMACHNKTLAPSLVGVFDRKIASVKHYEYSSAMKAYSRGESWDSIKLENFLSAPMKVIPGTKMAFQGLLNKDDRTALIEYLKQLK
jgi:cytochrome c2